MSYSEAVEGVGKLVAAFPNGSPANAKGYIGALAAVLADYPRVVAAKCCDPLKGVARDTRFLPTVADLVGWCEREIGFMRGVVERDDRQKQIAQEARDRANAEKQTAENRAKRPTLQQMQDQYGENWGIGAPAKEDLKVKAARLEVMQRANTKAFEAECKAAGVDPASGVSPSLARIVNSDWRPAE